MLNTRARVNEEFAPDYKPEENVDGKLKKFTIEACDDAGSLDE